jgi:glutaminyl-tRNA synthetase
MSKRRIIKLVRSGRLSGWDDPRLATIVGLRRRGFTPEILKDFCNRVGISRNNNVISLGYLEMCARDFFNTAAPRALAVIDPIRVTCINFPGMNRRDNTARTRIMQIVC